MSTNASSADYARFDELAEEFAARFRRGERPSLQEYIDRCPGLADEIRELFPALVEVERVEDQPQRPGSAATAVALPPLGQVGDYRVLREIGRGGMGVVYEAEQVSLGRRVALKVLPRQVSQDLKTLARFRREARSAAQLHHTNIVPVFEVGKDGDVSYYAMQFIQGQGLDLVINELRRLKERSHKSGPAREPELLDPPIPSGTTAPAPSRSRPVSRMAHSLLTGRFVPETPGGPGEAEAAGANRVAIAVLSDHRGPGETEDPPASEPAMVAGSNLPSSVVLPGGSQLSAVESGRRPFYRSVAHIGRQVAAGLSYAHARGIVHRDIKPSNLLLDNQGVVWITDFGLAKASDDGLTQTGDIIGTLRYMAPERFRGEGDGRADVYSLGLTLYELLTLKPAFDSPDRLQMIERIKTEDPPKPRALDPRIPRDLETIVLKAIHKDPQDRYPSAAAMGEDLRRFVEEEPIRARRVGPLEHAWIWAKRRPAAAALLLVSGAAVVALGMAATAFAYNTQLKGALRQTEQARVKAEEATKEAERQKYFHHIAVAHTEWRDGNAGRTGPLLEDCPRDQRNWEWHYLKRLSHPELLAFQSHRGSIWTLAFSPDGKYLASAGIDYPDHTVKIWDAMTARLIHSLPGHTNYIPRLAFSADGKLLASGSVDKTARVWDVTTGREIYTLRGHSGEVWTLSFRSDGTQLCSVDQGGTVKSWDLGSGNEVYTRTYPINLSVHGNALSPDGTRLASAGRDNIVRVWDTATGGLLHQLQGHTGYVWCLRFSPDGRRLASTSQDRTVRVWDAATGRLLGTLIAHSGSVWSAAFSPDGTRLASCSGDQTVRVWDAITGHELCSLRGHVSEVYEVAFSPDGMRLASTGQDGTVRIWSAAVRPVAPTYKNDPVELGNVVFSPDSARLAAGDNNHHLHVWDALTGNLIRSLEGHASRIICVAFSPDGRRLASAGLDKSVRIWDLTSGQTIRILQGHNAPIWSVAFSRDGEQIATAAGEYRGRSEVRIWDSKTGELIHTFPGQNDWCCSVAFSPDNHCLASAGDGWTVRVWNRSTGQDLFCFPGDNEPITTVAYSPRGDCLAAAGWSGTIRLWDATTGHPLTVLTGNTSGVRCLGFSPDGTRLASACRDQAVRIWDLTTYQEVISLRGHTDPVRGVAFSPDGARLASASDDGTVRVFDARPWDPEQASAEREALGLLDVLFSKPLSKADLKQYLQTSPTVSPLAREIALSLVDRYHEEKNPEMYHRESWALVRQPYLNAIQYRFALLQAAHVCRLAPDRQEYRIGLGAALYRAGQYREAIETLERADRLDPGAPAVMAFLAMAHHQLGEREQAQTDLARLREILDQPHWAKDAETLDLVHEAQALIPHDPIFPADPFAR
jgi:eukaryotic-like serine/threonine-protein kinase